MFGDRLDGHAIVSVAGVTDDSTRNYGNVGRGPSELCRKSGAICGIRRNKRHWPVQRKVTRPVWAFRAVFKLPRLEVCNYLKKYFYRLDFCININILIK